MSRDENERIRQQLRARPHLGGECFEERVALMQEVERLTATVEMLRDSVPKEWAIHVDDERNALEAEVERLTAERDEMRRLGREAEMERDTLAHANELLRANLAAAANAALENAEMLHGVMRGDRTLDLIAERDAARDAAEHLWFHGVEHGVSESECREWYPWLYELHEQKQAARREQQQP